MRRKKEKREFQGNEVQLVTFRLGTEVFGVHVAQVRSIGKVEKITHVPKMPEFIEGVLNLRGLVTTVIDLKKRFEIEGERITPRSRIIVAEIGKNQLGLIVDSVEDVVRVSPDNISPPPKTLSAVMDAGFLTSICKTQDDLILLIDLSKILSEPEKEKAFVLSKETAVGPDNEVIK